MPKHVSSRRSRLRASSHQAPPWCIRLRWAGGNKHMGNLIEPRSMVPSKLACPWPGLLSSQLVHSFNPCWSQLLCVHQTCLHPPLQQGRCIPGPMPSTTPDQNNWTLRWTSHATHFCQTGWMAGTKPRQLQTALDSIDGHPQLHAEVQGRSDWTIVQIYNKLYTHYKRAHHTFTRRQK